jgi:Fic family protein
LPATIAEYNNVDIADFTERASGRLVRTIQDAWAFVPNPLPPDVPLSWALLNANSRADRALAELAGLARNLPNPHLLMGPILRQEAVLSSRIEGIQTTLPNLLLFEAAPAAIRGEGDVREVANYVAALEHGRGRLAEIPVSLRFIREMHAILLDGVRGSQYRPGQFRANQNCIGIAGRPLADAIYVPPPVSEMLEALDRLESFLHETPSMPPLIRLAMIHYQFEAIHPFMDGNGRIGRLLLVLLLCAEGVLPTPLLYLSEYFERNRRDYYDLLLAVSQAGTWEDWLLFFLEGVAVQANDALRRSDRLLGLQRSYRERLLRSKAPATALQLAEHLFDKPAVTVAQAASLLGLTPAAAQKNVDRLVDAGILREATGRRRNRVWLCLDIVAIVETTEPSQPSDTNVLPTTIRATEA